MPRPYRLQGENCLYLITSRGNDRKTVFPSENDFRKFLEYLQKAKERFNFRLYAYCLMPSYYHLLIETLKPNLSSIMHYINSGYTSYYNNKFGIRGPLFRGRFKSIIVDKDSYMQELTGFIHLDPVHGRLVELPEEYRWSSYMEYSAEKSDGIIDKGAISSVIPLNEEHYRQFMLEAAARKYGKTPEQLFHSGNRTGKAKKVAIYLLRRLTDMTNQQIGESFGITYSAVSKAACLVERMINEDSITRSEIEDLIKHLKK